MIINRPWNYRLFCARATATGACQSHARRQSRRAKRLPEFLTIWKGADPDLPLLTEAKAEYEKLK
jgi:hypothetical protein